MIARFLLHYGMLFCLLPGSYLLAQEIEPKVVIGPETTYIDGPLTTDGYIDYLAHLNAILSKGVTPENNAAVLLLKASRGEISDEKYMKKYCKALGIKPQSLQGDYFMTYHQFACQEEKKIKKRNLTFQEINAATDKIDEQFDNAGKGAWTREKFPAIAQWIEASNKPLELVRKATLRPRYYHPLVNSSDNAEHAGPLVAVLLPQVQSARSFARVLMVRSLLGLGEGNIEQCTEDILTIRRLGNHIAQGATLVEQLVGIAIVGIAQNLEQKVALSGKLSTKQLLDYRTKMRKTAIKSNMLRSFSQCERFMYLDSVQQVMKGGMESMNLLAGIAGASKKKTRMQDMLDNVISSSIDWSVTMKEGNQLYDKYEKQLSNDEDWIAQDKVLVKMEKEIKELAVETSDFSAGLKALLGGPEYRGKMMGKVFVGLLLPALRSASMAEKRAIVMDDLSFMVITAAAHKSESGEFPRSIADFSKHGTDDLPVDRYANDDYRYRVEGNGFVVYSVGPNQKDEDGNGVFNQRRDKGDDYGAGYESQAINIKSPNIFK